MRRSVPYFFLVPYFGIFALFLAWPLIHSVYLSLLNTRVHPWSFQPVANWGRLFGDPAFLNALQNTLLILVVQVPLMLILAMVLALMLNVPTLRLRGLYRFAFFCPVVVGEVAYSVTFRLLFNTEFGAINAALVSLGFGRIDWLYSAGSAFAVVVIAITWKWAGYNALILLAGLQSIPSELYEAAEIDGANGWQKFWRITLPLVQPVLLFCLVLSVIGTLQLFAEPFLITRGGPGNATTTLGVYLYRQGFETFNFGYASVIGYTVAFIGLIFSVIQLKLFGRSQ